MQQDAGSQVGEESELSDYLRLRRLVLGDDYEGAIHRQLQDGDGLEKVSAVLSEAVVLRSSRDNSLGDALSPIVSDAIKTSISRDSRQITNIIFPIMGPAVRKAVASALTDMVQNLNTLLKQSFSLRSLLWRWQAWRSGTPYSEFILTKTLAFRAEQVFLVHRRTGLLLHSVTAPGVKGEDPELVSTMMIAIGDFLTDSFSSSTANTLENIRFGDLTLQIEVGPRAVLVTAVRGIPGDSIRSRMLQCIESVHRIFATSLKNFDGNRAEFDACGSILERCLISQSAESKQSTGKPWLGIFAVVVLLALLVWQACVYWLTQREQQNIVDDLRATQGYIIVDQQSQGRQLRLDILFENGLENPETYLATKNLRYTQLQVAATPIHIGPLPPPPKQAAPTPPTAAETAAKLAAEVQSNALFFQPKSDELTAASLNNLQRFIQQLNALQTTAEQAGKALQIMLVGFADSSGSDAINKKISRQRATVVRDMMIANGIRSDITVAWGAGNRDGETISPKNQRRVMTQVLLIDNNNQSTQGGRR